jgi:hypothetical protein
LLGLSKLEAARSGIDPRQCREAGAMVCGVNPGTTHMPIWKPIAEAPFDTDLQIGINHVEGVHALVFACRQTADGWIDSGTGRVIDVRPTHWRQWQAGPAGFGPSP